MPGLFLQPRAVAPQSALEPAGAGAAEIGWLWNLMLWLGTATTILVIVLLLVALFRRRDADEPVPEGRRPPDPRGELANDESEGPSADRGRPRSERLGTRWVLAGGVAFPAVVLTILFILSLTVLGAMYPRTADEPEMTIEVIGVQWWWDVQYVGADPKQRVRAANEIHIPTGQRVRVRLTAADVIHSFWIPGLQGKTDMIPGRTTETWLHAERPGVWRGQCAEFCGVQHAKMALTVVAHEPAEFEAWLAHQAQPARTPTDPTLLEGQRTFTRAGCELCHTVRGTSARATAGPDLTHVASRLTLAGGELPNTLGNLYGWIADPQALKPGSKMPAVPLRVEELHAIAGYLSNLR
jgi:cytochrome c oxidase subunit 2